MTSYNYLEEQAVSVQWRVLTRASCIVGEESRKSSKVYTFKFDPAIMEEAYGDYRQSSGKRAPEAIVGTTGIGLAKVIAERSVKDAQFQPIFDSCQNCTHVGFAQGFRTYTV